MANVAGELNSGDLKDTSMFKALTGRSIVTGQRKFLPPVNFVNYAKMVFLLMNYLKFMIQLMDFGLNGF